MVDDSSSSEKRDEPEGPLEFVVADTVATVSGVIDASTPSRILRLLLDHPEVTTLRMVDCGGSIDDEAMVTAARLVREHGLATHVPATGMVASGATDLFLAGLHRSAEAGARFGVHSWDDGDGSAGTDLPRDDPAHTLYIEYYSEMGIPAEVFYWFTMEAAPPDGIHWMTDEELERFNFLTGPAPPPAAGESSRPTPAVGGAQLHHQQLAALLARPDVITALTDKQLVHPANMGAEGVGMSTERLGRVSALCQRYVESGQMPCTQVLVARHGQVVLRESFGLMDVAAGHELAPDALFMIYSMTKPLTCIAALVCYEMGCYELDDPVSK
jgi:hypothetical protein